MRFLAQRKLPESSAQNHYRSMDNMTRNAVAGLRRARVRISSSPPHASESDSSQRFFSIFLLVCFSAFSPDPVSKPAMQLAGSSMAAALRWE